jgi:lysophospholipase L1-like esterase
MKRILIFGDSIMRGVYYSEEAGRHKLYGERLSELKEVGYEVKNCSIMGATVETGLDLIKKRLTVPADETTVLFEYGGNDCDFRWADISGDPTGTFSPNPSSTHLNRHSPKAKSSSLVAQSPRG